MPHEPHGKMTELGISFVRGGQRLPLIMLSRKEQRGKISLGRSRGDDI